MEQAKQVVSTLLKKADIELNGSRPFDPIVNDERLYQRLLRGGSLAMGESYMDGWWSVDSLDALIAKVRRLDLQKDLYAKPLAGFSLFFHIIKARLFNLQNMKRALHVNEQHYDIGNDLYEKMLDPWMQYTCAYWDRGAENLNEAQVAKLALIAEKLKLRPGMRVLDIGCGWGGLSKYLAQTHGVIVDGITLSKEQKVFADNFVKGTTATIHYADYRTYTNEPYDRIVSIGMFEAVGYKNFRTYMECAHRLLKEDGIFLLHTIGTNVTVYAGDPWIDKYIFPNGMLPSPSQISDSIERLFVMEDWHNFGPSYDKTLMAWYENFKVAWPELKESGAYDDRFYRMWEYYLLMCAGLFRARKTQLWQIILTKKGMLGGYKSVR